MNKPARYVVIGGMFVRIRSAAWRFAKRLVGRKPKPAPKPKPKPKPIVHPEGCDYVSGPTPAQLKAAGIKFVMRYLSDGYKGGDPNKPNNPKDITLAEAKALHAAGVGIGLVFETTANRALGGSIAGRSDAKAARRQATQLGFPAVLPIYYAVDFEASSAELKKVVAYFTGACAFEKSAKLVGVYGGYMTVKTVLDAKVADYAWQTYAWSGGAWDPRAQIQQYENAAKIGSATVDRDRLVHTLGGHWLP